MAADTQTQRCANAALVAAARNALPSLLSIAREAQRVMDTLAEYGPSIVPHLMDTDNNAGERLRQALAELAAS